jgi:hypothetical protein
MSKAKKYVSFNVSRLSSFSPGVIMNIREEFVKENHLDSLEETYVMIISKPMTLTVNKNPIKHIRVRFVNIESDLWVPVEDVKLARP